MSNARILFFPKISYLSLWFFSSKLIKHCEVTREQVVFGSRKSATVLAYNQLKSVTLKKGILGTTVIFRLTDGSVINFAGLPKQRAFELTTLLHANINWPTIQSLYHHYCSLTSGLSYIAQSEIAIFLKNRSDAALLPLTHILVLEATDKERAFIVKAVLRPDEVIRENVRQRNIQFVEQEKQNFASLFDTLEKYPLTEEQRLAIIRNEDNNLVIAGAGSGKTSTLVGRIGYLLKKGVPAESILVLAFAKKAAEELRERIRSKFDVDLEVQTFHALGLSLIGLATGHKPSLAPEAEDDLVMAETLENFYTARLQSDPEFQRQMITSYVSFRYTYTPEYEFPSELKYNEYISAFDLKTLRAQSPLANDLSLKGEKVKSLAELEIADYLFSQGINYQYEADYQFATSDKEHRQYKPDFYLPEYGIYIEHFGVDRDGHTAPYIDQQKYNAERSWKIETHQRYNTKLIQTSSWMKSEGILATELCKMLKKEGVVFKPRSLEELLQSIKQAQYPSQICKLCSTFFALFKGNWLSFTDLRKAVIPMKQSNRLRNYLYLIECLYSDYELKIKQANEVDFSDMIKIAMDLGKLGRYKARFSHILVDEFQDISHSRAELLKVLRSQFPHCRLFAVGDDWQSIYRFTGSDIGLMTNFDIHFGPTCVTLLQDTFRFNNKIAEFSSRFILKNSAQLNKTIRSAKQEERTCVHIRFQKKPEKEELHSAEAFANNAITALDEILSEISTEVEAGQATVFILVRYHFVKPNHSTLSRLQKLYPNLVIRSHTVHSVKGLEADYVIVGELKGGRYGFPSQIADDPILSLLLSSKDDCPYSEERRLFYVAVTRARRRAYLLSQNWSRSPFIHELVAEQNEYDVDIKLPNGNLTATCPKCKVGIMEPRDGVNGSFWSCSNFPSCRHTESVCPKCRTGWMKQETDKTYTCTFCGEKAEPCPVCAGRLTLKKGPQNQFWGCSNYNSELRCRYTRMPIHPIGKPDVVL
jgi:DNA helicase-4